MERHSSLSGSGAKAVVYGFSESNLSEGPMQVMFSKRSYHAAGDDLVLEHGLESVHACTTSDDTKLIGDWCVESVVTQKVSSVTPFQNPYGTYS